MQWKRLIPYGIVGTLGILLMNLIASTYLSLPGHFSAIEASEAVKQHLLGTLYCFLLGVLLEWRTVVKLIKKEVRLGFSPRLVPGLVILLVGCISPMMIIMKIGIFFPFPIHTSFRSVLFGPLAQSSTVQNILAVIAGSIIIKSLAKNELAIRE